MGDARLVVSTIDSEEGARQLAGQLVDRHLAACVSIVPGVHSVYRWQEGVEEAREWLLLIKTTAARQGELLDALESLHSYEVPEALVFEVAGGLPTYLEWMTESVQPPENA